MATLYTYSLLSGFVQPFPPYILILTRKKLKESIVKKGEVAQNEQFHLFPQCFLCNLYLKIP